MVFISYAVKLLYDYYVLTSCSSLMLVNKKDWHRIAI